MSTNNGGDILACRSQVLSREQREGERQRARVNSRRTSEDDRRALEVEEEDNILAKKVGKQKESEREEGEKIIVKNAGKQNETELE